MSPVTMLYLLLAAIPIAIIFGTPGLIFIGIAVGTHLVVKEYRRWDDEKNVRGPVGSIRTAEDFYARLWEGMPYHRAAALADSNGKIERRSRGYGETIVYYWHDPIGKAVYASFSDGKLEYWSLE